MSYSDLEFAYPGHPLPTQAGMTVGVIWAEKPNATTQCAICHKTATGRTMTAVKHIMFDGDAGVMGEGRILKYRRCRDCRDAKLHLPEGNA